MTSYLRPSVVALVAFTVLTGFLYPLVVTAGAQLALPHQADGSLIKSGDQVLGSELIGQNFTGPEYFWSRPSATGPYAYNSAASSGSNLGPTNDALPAAARTRIDALRAADPGNDAPIPVDLVTASGSGLDPHISPAAAAFQLERVARARGISTAELQAIVDAHSEGRTFGLLGEPRVNVLALNMALDALD